MERYLTYYILRNSQHPSRAISFRVTRKVLVDTVGSLLWKDQINFNKRSAPFAPTLVEAWPEIQRSPYCFEFVSNFVYPAPRTTMKLNIFNRYGFDFVHNIGYDTITLYFLIYLLNCFGMHFYLMKISFREIFRIWSAKNELFRYNEK